MPTPRFTFRPRPTLLLFLLFCLCSSAISIAQTMNIASIADITGDAANHQVSTSTAPVRWVLFIAPAANTAVVRIGDSGISATEGASLAAGGGLMLPPVNGRFYDLSTTYYRAATGDKLNIIWAR